LSKYSVANGGLLTLLVRFSLHFFLFMIEGDRSKFLMRLLMVNPSPGILSAVLQETKPTDHLPRSNCRSLRCRTALVLLGHVDPNLWFFCSRALTSARTASRRCVLKGEMGALWHQGFNLNCRSHDYINDSFCCGSVGLMGLERNMGPALQLIGGCLCVPGCFWRPKGSLISHVSVGS
ncbi:hypothetical protein XENOCAPTIV_026837, partial [Xenoophorus captivus]